MTRANSSISKRSSRSRALGLPRLEIVDEDKGARGSADVFGAAEPLDPDEAQSLISHPLPHWVETMSALAAKKCRSSAYPEAIEPVMLIVHLQQPMRIPCVVPWAVGPLSSWHSTEMRQYEVWEVVVNEEREHPLLGCPG